MECGENEKIANGRQGDLLRNFTELFASAFMPHYIIQRAILKSQFWNRVFKVPRGIFCYDV